MISEYLLYRFLYLARFYACHIWNWKLWNYENTSDGVYVPCIYTHAR